MFELKTLLWLLLFLLLEIDALLLLLLSLLGQRLFAFFQTKIDARMRAKISAQILFYLEKPQSLPVKRVFKHRQLLLTVLEAFNRRLQGGDWEQLKREIAARYLLPKARRGVRGLFWKKRVFAARVFALAPLPEDEEKILALLCDPVFLVRSIASVAAIALESRKGLDLIVQQMAQKSGYARYFYRDLLLQGSIQVFSYLAEMAAQTQVREVHLACLEVFAGKTVSRPLPFLERDLQSKDREIFLAALKVLNRNLTPHAEEVFMAALHHPDYVVRAEAAAGLKMFKQKEVVARLEEALQDPVWNVRLQAALSLSEMGEIDLLRKQSHNDAAKYALDFLG